MSEILDNIVKCDISIESPVEDGTSFSRIMLVGNRPLTGGKDLKAVDKYASLSEVVDAGWQEDSDIYKAVRAAFTQEPKTEFIYIAVREEAMNPDAGGSGMEGEEDKTAEAVGDIKNLEKYADTVKRMIGMAGWYGLILVGAEKSDYDEVANLIESAEKLFMFSTDKKESPLSRSDYLRSIAFYSESQEEFGHVAWMARCFSFTPGSESWAYKTLAGITPSSLTSREMRSLDEININYYITCASKNISKNGKAVGGEWIDVIRFRDWLKNQMQIKIFELFVKNPKIPFLDSGITLVENQMHEVLKSGQTVGGIADTEFDDNDEPVYGYRVTVPRAASLSSTQRKKRILPGCKFTARLAGAIHVAELQGSLIF